ncbi:MAG: RNA 2',3'-cyclic phosphodiesterase [Bacteroidales bacterium]|nr:RNA 2',3'-cyclic phosphodiesterase [Bacteroidales bacterium]
MKRIFAAIKIYPSDQFFQIYSELKSSCKYDRINWVQPYQIHVTLKFFGETEEALISEIQKNLREIADRYPPFELILREIGIFGSYYKPRVIWVGIEKNETLASLANEILVRMENLGFEKDRQNFVPHLTIGRIKYTDNKQLFQQAIERYKSQFIQEQRVGEFYLIESKLSTKGPTYSIIESYPLKKGSS